MPLAGSWQTKVKYKAIIMNQVYLNFRKPLSLVWLILVCGLVGCYKDETQNFAEEETITENAAVGQNEANDILEVDYQAEVFFLAAHQNPAKDSCALLSNDPDNKVLTIDFGLGCTFFFNRARSGKIFVKYGTSIGDTVARRTFTFENYTTNLKKISGTVEIGDFSIDPETTFLQATYTLTDFKVDFPNGSSVTFSGKQKRLWTFGRGDNDPTNNTYLIAGGLDGVASDHTFFDTITTPVVVNFAKARTGNFSRISGQVDLIRLSGYPDEMRSVVYHDTTKITVTTYRRKYTISVN
jgi:hypothetical protein